MSDRVIKLLLIITILMLAFAVRNREARITELESIIANP